MTSNDSFTNSVNASLDRFREAGMNVTETTFSMARTGESLVYTTTLMGDEEEVFHWLFEDFISEVIAIHLQSLDDRPYAMGFQRIPSNAMAASLRRTIIGEDLDQPDSQTMDPSQVTLMEEASKSDDMLLYFHALPLP